MYALNIILWMYTICVRQIIPHTYMRSKNTFRFYSDKMICIRMFNESNIWNFTIEMVPTLRRRHREKMYFFIVTHMSLIHTKWARLNSRWSHILILPFFLLFLILSYTHPHLFLHAYYITEMNVLERERT